MDDRRQEPSNQPSRRTAFLAGVRGTMPLALATSPFGLIFGAVAVANGISPLGTAAMSLFVFAGSGQFVAVQMVGLGASIGVIILTVWIVNLRHTLYAATLAPYLGHLPQRWLVPLAHWLTDETFLVVSDRYQRGEPKASRHWYYLGSALMMFSNWQFWTVLGIVAGRRIPDPSGWGLDFVLPLTFIAMLVPMLRRRPALAAAVVGGVSALALASLPHLLGLPVAVMLGVGAGAGVQRLSSLSSRQRSDVSY